MITRKIHHGIKGVLNPLPEPSLCILVDSVITIPSFGREASGISILTHRATTHLYPWLQFLYRPITLPNDMRDITPSPISLPLAFTITGIRRIIREASRILGIADIIKMKTINIIVGDNLLTDVHYIFRSTRHSGVKIIHAVVFLQQLTQPGELAQPA